MRSWWGGEMGKDRLPWTSLATNNRADLRGRRRNGVSTATVGRSVGEKCLLHQGDSGQASIGVLSQQRSHARVAVVVVPRLLTVCRVSSSAVGFCAWITTINQTLGVARRKANGWSYPNSACFFSWTRFKSHHQTPLSRGSEPATTRHFRSAPPTAHSIIILSHSSQLPHANTTHAGASALLPALHGPWKVNQG
jgi:hypothetical protein